MPQLEQFKLERNIIILDHNHIQSFTSKSLITCFHESEVIRWSLTSAKFNAFSCSDSIPKDTWVASFFLPYGILSLSRLKVWNVSEACHQIFHERFQKIYIPTILVGGGVLNFGVLTNKLVWNISIFFKKGVSPIMGTFHIQLLQPKFLSNFF